MGAKDIQDVQQMAIDFYNTLVRTHPTIRIPAPLEYVERCGSRYINREAVTISGALTNYPLQFWLDKYIYIRYNEQQKPLSEGAIAEMRKVIKKFQQFTNFETNALTFINNTIKTFDKFKGSYAQRVLYRRNAASDTDTQPTY